MGSMSSAISNKFYSNKSIGMKSGATICVHFTVAMFLHYLRVR